MSVYNSNLDTLYAKLSTLKAQELETGVDIGPLAALSNDNSSDAINTLVTIFTLFFVFTLDPLAVLLVSSYNSLKIRQWFIRNSQTESNDDTETTRSIDEIDTTLEQSIEIESEISNDIEITEVDQSPNTNIISDAKDRLTKAYDDLMKPNKSENIETEKSDDQKSKTNQKRITAHSVRP